MDEGEHGGCAWNCLDAWDPVQECMAQLAATRGCCGQGVDRTECCLLRGRKKKDKAGVISACEYPCDFRGSGCLPSAPIYQVRGSFLTAWPCQGSPIWRSRLADQGLVLTGAGCCGWQGLGWASGFICSTRLREEELLRGGWAELDRQWQTSNNKHGRGQPRLGRQGIFPPDSVIPYQAEAKIINYWCFSVIQGAL